MKNLFQKMGEGARRWAIWGMPATAQRRARTTARAGFTVLELLIVLAIITILMGLVLASFSKSKGRTADDGLIADMRLVRLALEEYKAECKVYPVDLDHDSNNKYQSLGVNTQSVCTIEFGDVIGSTDLAPFSYKSLESSGSENNCVGYLLAVEIDPSHPSLLDDAMDIDANPNATLGWTNCTVSAGSPSLITDDALGWFNHVQLPASELNYQ